MANNPELKIIPYFECDNMETAKTFKLIKENISTEDSEYYIGDMETCMYHKYIMEKARKKEV